MRILGNMKVLSVLSHVLTSLTYQGGYCRCKESQLYHYGRFAMLKFRFLAPKFRLRQVQKNEKKRKRERKMKNRVLQKTLFYFSAFTSWKWFWRLIRVLKKWYGVGVLAKNFFLLFVAS